MSVFSLARLRLPDLQARYLLTIPARRRESAAVRLDVQDMTREQLVDQILARTP